MPENDNHAAGRSFSRVAAVWLLALSLLMSACESAKKQAKERTTEAAPSDSRLSASRIDLAKSRPADEALALLASALKADPASEEARSMAVGILTKTKWHLPEITLDHRQTIDHVHFPAPSTMWVSLAGEANTTVRWNLDSLRIESALFPLKSIEPRETRSLTIGPDNGPLIVERAGILLLCDSQTLKPVRDIGPLPEVFAPSSVIVFSSDGLLLAHPGFASKEDPSIVWNLREGTTGQIIRKSEPIPPNQAPPLAAFLDRKSLRVLHADGSLLEMPVSPAEPVTTNPAETPVSLLHAQFAQNGGSALILKNPGPHVPPELWILPTGDTEDTSLEPIALIERFPWNRHPGIWTGLLRDPELARLRIAGNTAFILTGDHAPIHSKSPVTALAMHGGKVITGDESGMLTIHLTLPVPIESPEKSKAVEPGEKSLAAFEHLTEALAGIRYDENKRSFEQSATEQRLKAFADCDLGALAGIFPTLDFSPLVAAIKDFKPRTAAPDSLTLLEERLARAGINSAPTGIKEIEQAFEDADGETVLAAIKSAGKSGPAAAKALELALASTHPEWIEACLSQSIGLPPFLRQVAVSRIAWLQDRKADALIGWPDVFPELDHIRLREDWDGWELADYSQALEKLRLCVTEELAAIEVPANPTPEQRKAVIDRLTDPITVKAVGKARYAKACLKAALALSAFKEENESTIRLAMIARNLGEAPAPCLRAEAMSLTALGDYQNAHDRWITLITEHPVETQQPGDYAEAAYTAFENANPQQAMAILTTGLHRFPNDGNFALRAGWVALLTGNAERAYRFLLTGRQIGYPEEKIENATALMAIAAIQTGAAEDAAVFYQDLIRMDPAWENPETIETLEWPEELKSSLRQLVW